MPFGVMGGSVGSPWWCLYACTYWSKLTELCTRRYILLCVNYTSIRLTGGKITMWFSYFYALGRPRGHLLPRKAVLT